MGDSPSAWYGVANCMCGCIHVRAWAGDGAREKSLNLAVAGAVADAGAGDSRDKAAAGDISATSPSCHLLLFITYPGGTSWPSDAPFQQESLVPSRIPVKSECSDLSHLHGAWAGP